MTNKTVTLPAGTVLTNSRAITVQGQTIEANSTITLSEEAPVDVGAPSGSSSQSGSSGQTPGSRK